MKRNPCLRLTLAALLTAAPLVGRATVFFSDTFINGSTLNSASPANPTTTNTAYQIIANKSLTPTPTMTANDLKFGIAATSSGFFQAQALFATNQIALTQPGDYIQLTVGFTNTSGLLVAAGQLAVGLYNSGQVKPIAGGINNGSPATFTGGAQNWQGYVSALNFTGAASRISTRPAQSGSTIANEDLIQFGTSSSYTGGAIVGTATGNTTLVAGSNYTEVLTITLNDVNSLAITNTLYAGPISGGIVITNFGAVATNTTFLTSGFDGLVIGYTGRSASPTPAALMDVSSVKVDGSVTTISTPPTITAQPVPVTVANNGSCIFNISALGVNVTYQWRRNNTNLLNGGNISGATSPTLQINNASTADALAGANGYYCVVSGAGNFSTNSVTNSLGLVTAKNLVWDGGAGSAWDLNNTASWAVGQTFNYGDAVTFNDVGAGVPSVTLSGSFLSASKWLISGATAYSFSGSGSFAGTGSLIFNSGASGNLQLDLVNTHTGGTIVSNSNPELLLYLSKYQVLGNGPLTLATPGKMEIIVSGSATLGIIGDVIVNADFTNQFDASGSFAGVFLGNISGTSGKQLSLTPQTITSTASRYRVYGTNTVCNAKIDLNGNASSTAQYDGTVLACYGVSGSQTYNGVISGNGGIIQRGNALLTLNGNNTFAGGTTPTTGTIAAGHDNALGTGPINIAPEQGSANSSGTIIAVNGARTIANPIVYPSGTNNQTLIIGGTNNLTFTSPINLAGVDALGTPTNRTFTVNNSGATTFAGAISDGGTGLGLVKNGTNTLYLNAANTYSGLTTVSAGTLGGSGTITGSVLVTTNASIGGGTAAGISTLSVSGNLTLTNGGGFFRLNRTGSASDNVIVSGGLTNFGTGIITVTNLGATLQVGDTFTLFSKAVTGGNTLTVTGGGAVWTNKLALNGTIQVIPSVNTNPTNIVTSISGNVLTLSWPADHTGWRLQVQTNSVTTGLVANSNAWSTVSGSTSVNSTSITINPANGSVFYRLVYP